MVKALVGLAVVGALVLWGVYKFSGVESFDPTKQGEEARAAIQPGMTLAQVIDIAGEPRRYRSVRIEERTDSAGNKIETRRPGAEVAFDRATIERTLDNNGFPNGFILPYLFSERIAFHVWFDAAGDVESVRDQATAADLFDM